LTGRNLAQEPITPSYTPAGPLLVTRLCAILFKDYPLIKRLIPLAYSKVADGLEPRLYEPAFIAMQKTLHHHTVVRAYQLSWLIRMRHF
jgi:hypothetical protein